jgi:hypothetical protein
VTREEIIGRFLGGHLLLVGEFRGGRADKITVVDKRSGLKQVRVLLTYIVEVAMDRAMGVVKLTWRAPEAVTDPAQVIIGLEKGRRYAFELDGYKREHGIASGYLLQPEGIPLDAEGQGASPAGRQTGGEAPNLVKVVTIQTGENG